MAMGQNPGTLVNTKMAGKREFTPQHISFVGFDHSFQNSRKNRSRDDPLME